MSTFKFEVGRYTEEGEEPVEDYAIINSVWQVRRVGACGITDRGAYCHRTVWWVVSVLDGEEGKLQAQVYDILPPTTAISDYAIGLEKLSANSFSLVLKWQYVCNREVQLYQAFLL